MGNHQGSRQQALGKSQGALGNSSLNSEISTNYFGYAFSKKDAYISEASASLEVLYQNTSSLLNRLARAGGTTKTDVQQTRQQINHTRMVLDSKFDYIRNSTSGNWNDAKAAFAKSYYDLRGYLKTGWDSLAPSAISK